MRIFVGILLIIIGCVALFGIIVVPVLPSFEDNATVNNFLGAILCKPNEKLQRELYQTRDIDGTGYSMTPTCVDSERQREDVTGKWVLYGAGGFIVPFLIGLLFVITGANAAVRRRREVMFQGLPNAQNGVGFTFVNTSGSQASGAEFRDGVLRVDGMEIKIDDFSPDKIKAQMGVFSGGGDLTEKLRQLQEAKYNGLISSTEYDRLRQKILDDLS